MKRSHIRITVAALLAVVLVGATVVAIRAVDKSNRIHLVAYFANSNGIFAGDEIRVLGVPVGKIDAIEPQPQRAKISFWVDKRHPIPADAKAAILSPSLVTARAIQMIPPYTGGQKMADGSVIPRDRTAVPVEWDDFRQQLERLTQTLQPTAPGGASTLGEFVNTTAENLRGQGGDIRDTIIKMSQAFSALGDHSTDIFSTVKNLATLVTALENSTALMRELNLNLDTVTGLLANDQDEVGAAVGDINAVIADATEFVAENRETVGTTSDKVASVSQALVDSLADIKQTLHVAPNAFQDFVNIYQPAQGSLTGALAVNNFANPITFICSAIQAASRLGAAESSKLCVQYLAPIIKNRQYNFPPLGLNPFVGATARPNELTYSEEWMRPDYVPPQPPMTSPPPAPAPVGGDALAAEAPAPPLTPAGGVTTDPANGLQGMMVPPAGGR